MNARDRIVGLADVEDDDPEKANNKEGNHHRSKPLWALLRHLKILCLLVRGMNLLIVSLFADT